MTSSTFATFYIDEGLYGIEIQYLREIIKYVDISPVPHSPDYIKGLINLRGQIVTLIDLKKRLNDESTDIAEDTSNIILRTDQELKALSGHHQKKMSTLPDTVGFLVNRVDEIVEVDEAVINTPPENINENDSLYIEGVVELENRLLSILSVKSLLNYKK